MGVTVREAMQIGGLFRCKVVAGRNGLERRIHTITVMEVPDVIQWLKGDVLLLTSLYPIKDDAEAIGKLVRQLVEVGASALAVKVGGFFKEIPEAILEEGNRLHFPIIEIGYETSYLDIMTPLMQLIIKKSDPENQQLDSFFQWMTELALGGKGIPALMEAVEHMTGNPVTVGSELSALESQSKGLNIPSLTREQKNELKMAKRPIRMNRMLDNRMVPCIVTPLLLNEELYGDVTCWQMNREFLEQDFHVLDRTMLLIAMEFLKVMTKADVEQTFKDDFLSEVLLGRVQDQAETIKKGKLFGWDFTQSYVVYCISVNDPSLGGVHDEAALVPERKRKLLQRVNSFFRFENQKVIATLLKDCLIVLYPRAMEPVRHPLPYQRDPEKGPFLHIAESLRRHLVHEFEELSFTVGIGRFYPGMEGIHRGYEESVKAVKLGRPVETDGCVHYEDLGIFRMLCQFQDWGELETIYEETVGKLAEHDLINNSSLVLTLAEYFANNCSLSETAEKLFIHVNTMKYRLQKMEQVTEHNVYDAESRLLLHIGIKIHQMMQSNNQSQKFTI